MLSRASPSPGTERSTDPLAKLRIERSEPRVAGSRARGLFRNAAILTLLLMGLAGGAALALRMELISAPGDWLNVPEMIQSRTEVRTATVTVEAGRSADASVVATGYLESRRQAKIGARAPGRIAEVRVEEGSRVQAGQILAVLEHADLDASLAAVKATLSRAKGELAENEVAIARDKREYDRAESLRASGTVSVSEFDTAKFAYEAAIAHRLSLQAAIELAAARVNEAEQMIANMSVIAPFQGTVISKDAEVGESILPGGMGEASGRGSVVTVADLDHLEVECDVKEDYINRVRVQQSAEVAVDAVPGRRYDGKVRKIIPMGDRARATIKVKVEITNADEQLFPDMSATVYFLPDETTAAVEPARRRVFCEREAVGTDASGSFVWTVDEKQRLQRVAVKTGATRDNRVEITEGLTGSEQVVIAPADARLGQLVRLAP